MTRTVHVDPAHLDPAPPDAPRHGTGRERLSTPRVCTCCGHPATATGVLTTPDGQWWVDRCTACLRVHVEAAPEDDIRE